MHRPAIAILTPHLLTGLGLKSLLGEQIPQAEVVLFARFKEFESGGTEHYVHYFVDEGLFLRHEAFFAPHRAKIILLVDGHPAQRADMHQLDVSADEEQLIRSILRLQHGVHRPGHGIPTQPAQPPLLSAREEEVLTLIARGLMNKEIADRLHISTTTVISHRRNIMEKLGIKSVAGLTLYAVTRGYVASDDLGRILTN